MSTIAFTGTLEELQKLAAVVRPPEAAAPPPDTTAPLALRGHATLALLIQACFANNKIAAIKAVRELTYYGLKEAKDFVEASAGGSHGV